MVVNYLTDDPWNPIHRRKSFMSNLKHYDHVFSTKSTLEERLREAGAPSTSWLPFAYDPYLHYPVEAKSKEEAHKMLMDDGNVGPFLDWEEDFDVEYDTSPQYYIKRTV